MPTEDKSQGRAGDLNALAQAKLGKLSDAESLLLEKVPTGDLADCSTLDDKGDDPKEAGDWTPQRRIRAELVAWLCMNEPARKQVHPRGIQVHGADIIGPLDLSFVNIPFQVMLVHCRIRGDINLERAQVSELDLRGSLVKGIAADGMGVKNDVSLRDGFTANGEVHLMGAEIGGDFECDAGTFINEGDISLIADGLDVKGDVSLRDGFAASGEVRLLGANVGGDFNCSGGRFANQSHAALSVDRINVKGGVFLARGFTANGEVRLLGAQIGGDVDCEGGEFMNEGGDALSGDRSVVKGSVLLSDGFKAEGRVSFVAAEISGPFECNNGNFHNASLDLRDVSAGSLYDSGLNDPIDSEPTQWPQPSKLFLDGFTYGRISSLDRINVDRRLAWLALQPKTPFRTRPYLQLAKVLQESGDPRAALIVKERMEELGYAEQHSRTAGIESWILRTTIGYGYYPLRALKWDLGLGLLGWIIYRRSYLAGAMAPSDKDAYADFKKAGGQIPEHYPPFSPLVYSVENSLPLVKLGQGDKWQPDPERQGAPTQSRPATEFGYRVTWAWLPGKVRRSGQALLGGLAQVWSRAPKWFHDCWGWVSAKTTTPRFVMWFLWFQILLGWLLATLFVAGVAGIVHKD